ncbi:hypothetical protein HYH03_001548 [Edaphochlamys debaryana]|uniref:F-box domain-containing protein n=1 Tax=Edaphochlamys debaryana TaxID=47281 RepID=A0A836C524_9CHLO|nr:hypothetical protein HYH03_001548 [Edaphochlamys debaryana]|eukprot:KAG2500786.1 hypothetical protein HYH03_001548 [Edaphochlamys debaryana]
MLLRSRTKGQTCQLPAVLRPAPVRAAPVRPAPVRPARQDQSTGALLSGLPTEVADSIFKQLSSSELACLRPVNRATAVRLQQHKTIHLSHPVPHWAFVERWGAPEAFEGLNGEQRSQVVLLTAASNSVDNLKVALAMAPKGERPPWDAWRRGESLIKAAAKAGAGDPCRWLAQEYRGSPHTLLHVMAAASQRTACEEILQPQRLWPPEYKEGLPRAIMVAAWGAACGGHLLLTEWLLAIAVMRPVCHEYEDPRQWGPVALILAAAKGEDLATLQRCYAENTVSSPSQWMPWGLPSYSPLAAALSSPTSDWRDKAEWLVAQGHAPHADAYMAIAESCGSGAPERFAWLLERRCGPESRAINSAIRAGNVAGVEWLLARGVKPYLERDWYQYIFQNTGPLAAAVMGGHVGVLQALKEGGLLSDLGTGKELLRLAARAGISSVVQWTLESFTFQRQRRLCWSDFEVVAAAGFVESLRRLHQLDCPMRPKAWSAAMFSGRAAEIVKLLAEWGCAVPDTGAPYVEAIRRKAWSALPLLRGFRVPLGPNPEELIAKAKRAKAPAGSLKWLSKAGRRAAK